MSTKEVQKYFVGLLNRQIEEARKLIEEEAKADDPKFITWKDTTEAIICGKLLMASPERAEDFKYINYSLGRMVIEGEDTTAEEIEECKEGLEEAIAKIEALKREIEDFGIESFGIISMESLK